MDAPSSSPPPTEGTAAAEDAAAGDAGDAADAADAAHRGTVRWLATRTWSGPAAAGSDSDAGADTAATGGERRAAPAQLVLTAAGPIGISTYTDERERRHPIVARRFDADGTAGARVAVLAQYTGELYDIAASARGSTLWALWRADATMESLDRDAKHIAVSAQLDLQRASVPIMVAQRVQRGSSEPFPLVAIEAREDGGAWAYVGVGTRPAAEVDPMLRTGEDTTFDDFITQGVEIDPSHRVSPVARHSDLFNVDRCARIPATRALFLRVSGPRAFVFGDYVADCAPELSRPPAMLSDSTVRWDYPSPHLPRTSEGTLLVSDGRIFVARSTHRQLSLQEHAFRIDESDAGVQVQRSLPEVRYPQSAVLCAGGELYLTARAPALRLRLTGPDASVDLATLLLGVLAFDPEVREAHPRTMVWTGTHLLYLPTEREFFQPRLRRWRCDHGALVED